MSLTPRPQAHSADSRAEPGFDRNRGQPRRSFAAAEPSEANFRPAQPAERRPTASRLPPMPIEPAAPSRRVAPRLELRADERLAVASAITGGERSTGRPSMLKGAGFALLALLALIGAVAILHSLGFTHLA